MFHQEILSVYATAEIPLTAVHEVNAIVANMKTDHITSEHPLEQFIGPREKSENVPRREGNVQEKRQLELQIFLLGLFANVVSAQHKVVVMHPNDRNTTLSSFQAALDSLDCLIGKKLISIDISAPVISGEDRAT